MQRPDGCVGDELLANGEGAFDADRFGKEQRQG